MQKRPLHDIVELFGFSPDDLSPASQRSFQQSGCPFTHQTCDKRDRDGMALGVCSVTADRKGTQHVVICPNRLYAESYRVLRQIVAEVWPGQALELFVGGSLSDLRERALQLPRGVVAFGKGSGQEVAAGDMSLDWVLQRYVRRNATLHPDGFVGVEVQSIDITGNYRAPLLAYRDVRLGLHPREIPRSGHGLNWANVHKRLLPQIIRKGNIYTRTNGCAGFYFVVPEQVFARFASVLDGTQDTAKNPGRETLSVLRTALSSTASPGRPRALELRPTLHYSLAEVAAAFIRFVEPEAPGKLEGALRGLLRRDG